MDSIVIDIIYLDYSVTLQNNERVCVILDLPEEYNPFECIEEEDAFTEQLESRDSKEYNYSDNEPLADDEWVAMLTGKKHHKKKLPAANAYERNYLCVSDW